MEHEGPKATVGAIITRGSGAKTELLLTKRNINPFKGYWCIPGGHIEQYERAEDAIAREVKEETGLDFNATFFRYFDEILPDHAKHNVVLVYHGAHAGNLKLDPDEVQEAGWFSFTKALTLPLAFNHNEVILAYCEEKNV